jgi:hypothetical protein
MPLFPLNPDKEQGGLSTGGASSSSHSMATQSRTQAGHLTPSMSSEEGSSQVLLEASSSSPKPPPHAPPKPLPRVKPKLAPESSPRTPPRHASPISPSTSSAGSLKSSTSPRQSSTDIVPVNTANKQQLSVRSTPLVRTNPKFAYLSEEKAIPTQLNHLQQTSLRRRHDFQTNVHDLECRVAAITASLAQEEMECHRSLKDFCAKTVYHPLEQASEEIFLRREHSTPSTNWVQLEGRLSALDSNMTHSIHVDLETTKRAELDSLQEELEHEIEPLVKLETHKADKREGSLFRRWEDLCGTMARRFQEERATRMAVAEVTSRQMRSLEDFDERKAEEYLDKITQLRQKLDEERATRQASDRRIYELILGKKALLKDAMWEVTGDPTSSEGNENEKS